MNTRTLFNRGLYEEDLRGQILAGNPVHVLGEWLAGGKLWQANRALSVLLPREARDEYVLYALFRIDADARATKMCEMVRDAMRAYRRKPCRETKLGLWGIYDMVRQQAGAYLNVYLVASCSAAMIILHRGFCASAIWVASQCHVDSQAEYRHLTEYGIELLQEWGVEE